jgi:hypothetical protein
MPTTPISSVIRHPGYADEDKVDWDLSSDEDEDNIDSTCEKDIVGSPEPREGSMRTERHSISNTQDGGKTKPLYASDDRPDLSKRSLVSIHNRSIKALDRQYTVCNKADIVLIQEDTTEARKGYRESVPSTNPRSRSGTYNPARWFCKYVNTPAGCRKGPSCTFSHQHKGTKCFKFEKNGWCTNKTCVFVHNDNYTQGHRFERYYR